MRSWQWEDISFFAEFSWNTCLLEYQNMYLCFISELPTWLLFNLSLMNGILFQLLTAHSIAQVHRQSVAYRCLGHQTAWEFPGSLAQGGLSASGYCSPTEWVWWGTWLWRAPLKTTLSPTWCQGACITSPWWRRQGDARVPPQDKYRRVRIQSWYGIHWNGLCLDDVSICNSDVTSIVHSPSVNSPPNWPTSSPYCFYLFTFLLFCTPVSLPV